MAAADTGAQVRAWALAEIDAQCFGEDYGVDIAWDAVPTPQGVQVMYRVMVSCRSPLLGQGPLFSLAPLPSPQPTAEMVKAAATETIRQLRDLSAKVLAGANQVMKPASNGHRAARLRDEGR